jgi:hypothetical protein
MQLPEPTKAPPGEGGRSTGRSSDRGAGLWLRALALLLAIEVGLLLLTLPWTQFWDRGIVWLPSWAFWRSAYARGAVSGLGVVNLWAAASEITRFRF